MMKEIKSVRSRLQSKRPIRDGKQVYERINGWMDGRTNERTHGWVEGRTKKGNEGTEGWMDGQINEQTKCMDGQTRTTSNSLC